MRAVFSFHNVAIFAAILLHQSTNSDAFIHGRVGLLLPTVMKTQKWDMERRSGSSSSSSSRSSTAIGAGNIFDSFRQFWGGQDNNSNDDDEKESSSNLVDDDLPAGTTVLASIPVKSMKPGGLRLFLMFYCMGMQNTPDRNTWRADRPTTEEYCVDMLYQDATGILTIELLEETNEIRIIRSGSTPSTAYLMQESVIIQGIINELRQCAFDDNVPIEDRLLVPESDTSLDAVGEELAFG